MQNLNVVLVQANQLWEDKEGNLQNYTHLLQDVKDVDLIVLPEMFHTGFSMNPSELAETMDHSSGLTWLKSTAKEKNAAIYTSLIVSEQGVYHNRGVFVYPNGDIVKYDKRKCFGLAGEDKVFTAGENETIVEFRDWKFQLQICYDLRFPEMARNKIDSNLLPKYDVLLYVANWPEKRKVHWQTLLTARAIENQCYAVGVNRVGTDGKGLTYSGDSMVADALGQTQNLTPNKEEIRQIIFSKNDLQEIRSNLPFLKD